MGKENNAKLRNIKTYNFAGVEADKRLENQLKKASEHRPATAAEKAIKDEMMALAQKCYDSGLKIDELPESMAQYKDSHFFKVGYAIAERKAVIAENQSPKKAK